MHGLRAAFEEFINKTEKGESTHGTDNSKAGEMIAKYVNMLLRGGSKVIPAALTKSLTTPTAPEEDDNEGDDEESEINEQLDQVLDLFRFLHGKAVFEAFYKNDLAKRLLTGRSASADAELSMLARLKNECGSGFTQNLEKMFKDIELSREEMTEYKARQTEAGSAHALDLFVNVLSASAWPTYPDIAVNIPAIIKQATEKFEKSYQVHHSGRRLTWKHKLANCLLRANFPSGKKELVASGFQGIVLLLFSNIGLNERISYQQIKAETGLRKCNLRKRDAKTNHHTPADAELKSTLQELACAKIRPLRKHPAGKDIAVTDTFAFNDTFTHPKNRIKINQIQLRETKEENKETHERVQADRNFETQAAVVRIMKSKKTIGHNLLIAEVIEATRKRGVLSVQDIKRNIDRLIDKEYMERDEGNTYNYVA
jgi:cullin-4